MIKLKKISPMMIGKIKELNFSTLLLLITFSLIVNSFIFSNLNIINIFLICFFVSLLITKYGIQIFKKLNLLQNIRKEGPSLHLIKKNTPTMGGIFIILPFLLLLLIIDIYFNSIRTTLILFCSFSFFVIGFLEDYISIRRKNNTGLKSNEKYQM